MKLYPLYAIKALTAIFFIISSLNAVEEVNPLPEEIEKIMHQKKYDHAIWGLYVKDLQTGKILYDLNSERLFSPASTSKLFSVSALLHAFGNDYRFKTPVYADGTIKGGKLFGNLILVAQGDLTLGGRQPNANTVSFTKMDHIVANNVPGAILTKEDPLKAINDLAKQVYQSGITEIKGNVLIDDTLFETTQKRGMILSPIMINENLIDVTLNPTVINQVASITWGPQVAGYTLESRVKTVAKEGELDVTITADPSGRHLVVTGTIPIGQKDIVRTYAIQDPKTFAQDAFVEALKKQGVKISNNGTRANTLPKSYENVKQVALWTSPPLSEYSKLILKVSHNLGADLVPLLLASQKEEKTFDYGMRLFGDFVSSEVGISPDEFVFVDAAGGNENRLTPHAEIQLLEYIYKQSPDHFRRFFDALPILGVDGSLEDFAKNSPGAGKVRAKTGTGIALNLSTGKLFLITQALAGYIQGKNDHLWAYMLVVNNGTLPTLDDINAIFEDESQLSSAIYEHTDQD